MATSLLHTKSFPLSYSSDPIQVGVIKECIRIQSGTPHIEENVWTEETEWEGLLKHRIDTMSNEFFIDVISRTWETGLPDQNPELHDDALFMELREQWRVERGITSSLSDMIVCPSYLKIIGMGGKALPLILKQLKSEGDDPDHWFTALQAITHKDPVPEDAHGDTVKMAKAWLLWAEQTDA